MNVFNIKKQCDQKLIYSEHAIERARERKVPMPKYVPMDTVCVGKELRFDEDVFKLVFNYSGHKYGLVVSKSMVVITVYTIVQPTIIDEVKTITKGMKSIKQYQRNLRCNKSDEYYILKEGKYRHLEFEVGFNSYSYA